MEAVATRKQTFLLTVAAVLTVVFLMVLGGRVSATQVSPSRDCNSFSAGATVVDPNKVLIAPDPANEKAGPVLIVAQAAGNYKIEAESFSKSGPQSEEQWYMNLYKGATLVFTTDTTPDLDPGPGPQQFVLHASVALPEFDAVEFVHKNAGKQGSPDNSVDPCAAFLKLADAGRGGETPVTTPTTPVQVVVPKKPVAAGNGGTAASLVVPVLGLLGSVAVVGLAVRKLLASR